MAIQTPQTPQQSGPRQTQARPSAWQRFGNGFARFNRIVFLFGLPAAAGVAGLALIADAALPKDSPARPSSIVAGFLGDTGAGIDDRVRAVEVKWNAREHDAISRIDRETVAIEQEVLTRRDDVLARIGAADSQVAATMPVNWFNQLACAYTDVQRGGLAGPCAHAEKFRQHTMKERERLIGEVELLYDDDQLRSMIGLPDGWEQALLPEGAQP